VIRNKRFWWEELLGGNAGYLADSILVPKLLPILNGYGHTFTITSPKTRFYGVDGKRLVVLGLSFESENEMMFVKTEEVLTKDDVEYHVKQLKLLREKGASASLKEKTLCAAVAGLEIDDDAREMALELGMYVVEMDEDKNDVNVTKPSVELGKW